MHDLDYSSTQEEIQLKKQFDDDIRELQTRNMDEIRLYQVESDLERQKIF